MAKLALLVALVSVASTGCAAMGTRRPAGGQPIQKTATVEETKTIDASSGMGQRADLGER